MVISLQRPPQVAFLQVYEALLVASNLSSIRYLSSIKPLEHCCQCHKLYTEITRHTRLFSKWNTLQVKHQYISEFSITTSNKGENEVFIYRRVQLAILITALFCNAWTCNEWTDMLCGMLDPVIFLILKVNAQRYPTGPEGRDEGCRAKSSQLCCQHFLFCLWSFINNDSLWNYRTLSETQQHWARPRR